MKFKNLQQVFDAWFKHEGIKLRADKMSLHLENTTNLDDWLYEELRESFDKFLDNFICTMSEDDPALFNNEEAPLYPSLSALEYMRDNDGDFYQLPNRMFKASFIKEELIKYLEKIFEKVDVVVLGEGDAMLSKLVPMEENLAKKIVEIANRLEGEESKRKEGQEVLQETMELVSKYGHTSVMKYLKNFPKKEEEIT